MAMHYVISEHQRDPETGLFHRNPLKFTDIIDCIGIEHISTSSTSDIIQISFTYCRTCHIPVACKQDHLTYLFIKGHYIQKGIDPRIDVLQIRLLSAATGCDNQGRR